MQKEDVQYQKMTKTPIPKLILSLSLPTMFGMLVTSAYSVADAYFVSDLGTSAVGATGIVFSIIAMIQAIGFTVGMGAGNVISRLLGKKKEKEAQKVASSSLAAALILGLGFCALGRAFLKPLLQCLGATKTILPYAVEYAGYILFAAPFMIVSFALNNLLRSEGKTNFAMIGISAAGLLNIALDPFFIFYLNMGIKGAALATFLSQMIGAGILLLFFRSKKTIIRFSVKNISRDFFIYKNIFGCGIPSLFRQGLASVAAITLNRVAAAQGDAAVAAMSVVGKIFMVVFCVLVGLGQGYQPAAGYNFGAKEYKRLKLAYSFMLWLGVAGMVLFGVGLYVLTPWLIGLFVPKDSKALEIGIFALRAQCMAMPFIPLGIACNMTFQVVGKSGISAFLASCRQGVFFLPFIWLLPKFFGNVGMAAAQPLADLGTFLVCIPFISRFWKGIKNKK